MAVTEPSMTSAWPETYLVQATIDRSTPWDSAGKNKEVAQVLSSKVAMPRLRAIAQTPGTSCTSKVSEPGLSMKMARVESDSNASSSSALASGS